MMELNPFMLIVCLNWACDTGFWFYYIGGVLIGGVTLIGWIW